MPLVSMRQILDHAAENNYGVPAFNINDMEQIIAVLEAAKEVNAPVIIQTSTGARKFAGDPMIRHMIAAGIEMYPELPICLHQDHGSSVDICQSALVNGYSSVMMDGSLEADGKTPSSFEYNVHVTKEVVARAHAVGASVEGELGVIGSLETGKGDKEDGHGAEGVIDKKRLVTDPDEAAKFVAETNIDALAVAVGTSHGAYKFTRKPTGDILAIDVIEKIHAKLPNTHMVMHGSSSVPQNYVKMINENGGKDNITALLLGVEHLHVADGRHHTEFNLVSVSVTRHVKHLVAVYVDKHHFRAVLGCNCGGCLKFSVHVVDLCNLAHLKREVGSLGIGRVNDVGCKNLV